MAERPKAPIRLEWSSRSQGLLIPGRRGRYENGIIHETKDCPSCEFLVPVEGTDVEDYAGVCVAAKHWRLVFRNRGQRKPRKCDKGQKLAWRSGNPGGSAP